MSEVLFITDHFNTGGAPVVIRDLSLALNKQGVKVTLLILSEQVAHHLPDSIEVVLIPFVHSTWWERQQRYAHHARLLDDWLKQHEMTSPSLVVAHMHHAHQVVTRSLLSKQAWYCLHSNPEVAFLGNKQGWSRYMKRLKVRQLYQNHKLIGVSGGIIKTLQSAFGIKGNPAIAIHNPLDLDAIQIRSLEPVHDVPEHYLLFVGRFEQRSKRFDRLLQAYADSGVTMPLILLGKGDAHNIIEAEIARLNLEGQVHLLGHRDNPYAYMRRAHALVLSSDYEGFPLVVAESLACQTPVVSTDCPTGPREILTGDLARYLVPLDEPEHFAKALRDVVEHPPQISPSAVLHLSTEQVAKRYLALEHVK